MAKVSRAVARQKRRQRIRKRVFGAPTRPRLNVFRSSKHIYAQVIDDERGHTLAAASTLDPVLQPRLAGLKKAEQARLVGELLAERALGQKVKQVVFDRGGYLYHGRVRALADGARKGGLEF
ncbi:MAG: 50S ribosomal protein L18 [Chloroflexi bacterium]|nr:50S ribosomal protein L18 [Chloroflexota bacterium]